MHYSWTIDVVRRMRYAQNANLWETDAGLTNALRKQYVVLCECLRGIAGK